MKNKDKKDNSTTTSGATYIKSKKTIYINAKSIVFGKGVFKAYADRQNLDYRGTH